MASAHENWCEEATSKYTEKISHFVNFEVQQLKSKKLSRESFEKKLEIESNLILKFLKNDDYVILFDEKGRMLNSIEFSKNISQIVNSGKKRVVWILGGAYGVSEEVKQRSQLKLNLAPFVLNHLIAQIVCLEQIYRGFTIIKGLPYHNA